MKPLQRIIYVDDEEYLRELVVLALEDNFQISTFSSGVELMQAMPMPLPDLLLLDAVLPQMDGPAILKALCGYAGFADIPVIFMTAETRPEEFRRLLHEGALGILAKPIDITSLADEIQVLWNTQARQYP